jgi:subtilisin family serine protease
MQRGERVASDASLRRMAEVDPDGMVTVDIKGDVTAGVLAYIDQMGGSIVSSVPAYRAVRARMPVDGVEPLAALDEVQSIKPAEPMMTAQAVRSGLSTGSAHDETLTNKVNTSEGDAAHRASLARTYYGVNGAGIGIGVLSDGVNSLAARQASGDIPSVTVLSGQAGSGDEGTAMLEIVTDLAPGANLFFATANGGQAQFAANIEALCNAGAKVIVDDVFYLFEAVFMDGTVATGVNNATNNGCVYFSSAGNSGNKDDGTSGVWEGDFVAAASNPPGVAGTAHNFGSGENSDQITKDTANGFVLQWADAQGASANDYDLYLFNSSLTTIIDVSDDVQNGTQDPVEFISSAGSFNDLNNRLVIVKFSGANRYLHLNTLRGQLSINTTGQTAGHAAAKNAFGVAAVDVRTASGGAFTGGTANPVEKFSSDGLRRIFFQPNGTAITPGNFSSSGGEVVQKPDLAAADCVSTSTPGFSTFCGTSAAAPHAAAIAALMLQAVPSLTRSSIQSAINARALDIEAAGTDRDSGAGIVDALGAVGRTHPAFTDPSIVAGSTVIKARHLSELRNRVNALRARCGLTDFTFTDATVTGGATIVKAIHITELRSALDAAYTACGVTRPTYTDPTLSATSTAVKAVHITELRTAVTNLE